MRKKTIISYAENGRASYAKDGGASFKSYSTISYAEKRCKFKSIH